MNTFTPYRGTRPISETSIDDIPLAEQQAFWAARGECGIMSETDMETLYAAWREAQAQTRFTVYSSHGSLVVDADTGLVLSCEFDKAYAESAFIGRILSFDVIEWKATYPTESLSGADIDILDLGYCERLEDGSGTFHAPPEHDWRAEHRGARVTP